MIYEPSKYLFQAVASKLIALGYATDGVNTFPRFEVHSFDTTPTLEKERTSWEVTFIMEAITNDSSPGQSLDMVENIKQHFSETLPINYFNCVIWQWDILTSIEEVTDTELNIWRQVQRVRVTLQQNNTIITTTTTTTQG